MLVFYFEDCALCMYEKKEKIKITTTAGLEPARAKPKRFLIFRLNHSAKLPLIS